MARVLIDLARQRPDLATSLTVALGVVEEWENLKEIARTEIDIEMGGGADGTRPWRPGAGAATRLRGCGGAAGGRGCWKAWWC